MGWRFRFHPRKWDITKIYLRSRPCETTTWAPGVGVIVLPWYYAHNSLLVVFSCGSVEFDFPTFSGLIPDFSSVNQIILKCIVKSIMQIHCKLIISTYKKHQIVYIIWCMLKLWNDSSLTCEIIWNFSFLFMFRYNHDLYGIQIRSHERLHLYPLRTSNAHSAMRHRIQELFCRFPTAILEKSRTHSITSFASHAKFHLIDSYCSECVIP